MISMIGSSILAPEKLERFNKLSNDMAKIYSTAKVPAYKDKSKMLSLEPGLTEAMANSRLVSFIVDIPDIKIMREINVYFFQQGPERVGVLLDRLEGRLRKEDEGDVP